MNFIKYTGREEFSNYKKDRQVKTIRFDEITANGNTVYIPTVGMPKGTFYVKVAGNSTLEFQGSAIGGVDEDDWINLDEHNKTYNHNNKTEAYSFVNYANFIRIKVTGVTGTVNITVILGE